ncbi:MAG: CoA-binding protein [Gammaproteobacteria bacterium]|nr:CoA-binding protein [Gammaproteobacteria bacterium]
MSSQNVVVLGASPKEARYSNKAVRELLEHGHKVFPVHPLCESIHGQACYKHIDDIAAEAHTLTLYVGQERSTQQIDSILRAKLGRIIMNPGAENDLLETKAIEQGIEVVRGCTLVMLRTGQF